MGSTVASSTPTAESRWWYAVAAGLVLQVLAVALALYTYVSVLAALGLATPLPVLAFGTAGFVRRVALAGGAVGGVAIVVGLRLDASRVTRADCGWWPSPRRYAYGTLALLLVAPVLVPLVAGYYLAQRHRHLGTP